MNCRTEELFTLQKCPKCGGPAIWKISRFAAGYLEQCLGCGEITTRLGAPEYRAAPLCPADTEARTKMQDLKREHEAVRVYIGRVEDCIRDGERLLNSPGEDGLAQLRKQAFTLYYTLANLKEAAQRHEEREDDLLRCYLEPDLAEFIKKQHEEIRREINRATEVIGKVLPGQVNKNQLQEFCVSVRRILEPLFATWREHLTETDLILDTLCGHAASVEQPV
jgi:ssDNA-binding Zn-finger/Zn-ribbon topoisomerase 1